MIVAESLAPTPSTVLAAPAAPVAPAAYVTFAAHFSFSAHVSFSTHVSFAAHVAPADLRVFGNKIAAVKEQDDTVYSIVHDLGIDERGLLSLWCFALHRSNQLRYHLQLFHILHFFY